MPPAHILGYGRHQMVKGLNGKNGIMVVFFQQVAVMIRKGHGDPVCKISYEMGPPQKNLLFCRNQVLIKENPPRKWYQISFKILKKL